MICTKCRTFADTETRIVGRNPISTPRLGHADCRTLGCCYQHRAGQAIPDRKDQSR
jgi:hypothetical protein